mmetsp:Transcript_11811/g.24246  ORF Transcript_11811/g.24246 Transcript_11811/m.24246 type:complete len:206 (-) Transcript_11811:1211-1828(-)
MLPLIAIRDDCVSPLAYHRPVKEFDASWHLRLAMKLAYSRLARATWTNLVPLRSLIRSLFCVLTKRTNHAFPSPLGFAPRRCFLVEMACDVHFRFYCHVEMASYARCQHGSHAAKVSDFCSCSKAQLLAIYSFFLRVYCLSHCLPSFPYSSRNESSENWIFLFQSPWLHQHEAELWSSLWIEGCRYRDRVALWLRCLFRLHHSHD